MFEKVVARRLKKPQRTSFLQKLLMGETPKTALLRFASQRLSDANLKAKNAGYQKIRNSEARKMMKRANLMKKSINHNRRFGV